METCGRCGRKLKTQKSIDDGYGPVCRVKQAVADVEFERIQITLDEVIEQELMAQ